MLKNYFLKSIMLFIGMLFMASALQAQIYVNSTAGGANDGTSWTHAYTDLQSALAVAVSGDEIWVSAGTYYPTQVTTDREATFQLINGVAIYGGFAGIETMLTERDWVTNETILSGDINQSGDLTGNSYTLVTGSGTDALAVIDGFTITGGNADSSSGGDDNPNRSGGGMHNINGSPTVLNCTFSGNYANSRGGGMFNLGSSPEIRNCTFLGNEAVSGGGMHNRGNSASVITNCIFAGNFALHDGGGINNFGSSPVVTNCTFFGNSTNYNGGGIFNFASSPEVINSTFSGNEAVSGGAILNWNSSSPNVVNCILWGNSSEIQNFTSLGTNSPTVTYSVVQGGYAGTANQDVDPLFVDQPPVGHGTAGDLRLTVLSPAINAGNNAAVPGGNTIDLDGNKRIFGGTVDMGAYEAHFCEPVAVAIVNPDFEILYKAGSTSVTSPPLTNGQHVMGPDNLNMTGPTVTFSDNTTGNSFNMAGWTFNTQMGVNNFDSQFNESRGNITLMNGASFGGGTDEKTMSQLLTEDVQQNSTYTLTADFGWRNDNSLPSPPLLRLYAGATLLTPVTTVDPPLVQGNFVTYSRTYYVDDPNTSGPLRIEFGMAANTDGQQLNTDRIRLFKTPEDCTLLPGEIASSQTICFGDVPDPFTSITSASGIVGELGYQWQISTASPTFVDIPGAVSETYSHTGTVTQTTWFRRLAMVDSETEWVESNVVQVDVDPLPIAIISGIIDDFENGLPTGIDGEGMAIGFITFGDFGSGTTVSITTTQVAETDPLAMPGQSGDNYLLRFDANVNDFGGLTHAFENEDLDTWVTQDWSSYEGIAFWLYGQNTGDSLYFEIQDNRNPGSTAFDVELWTHFFVDDFYGWRLFTLNFDDDFIRKEIGNGAPDDGFGRDEVHGWVFAAMNTEGAVVTYYLDNVMVYGNNGSTTIYEIGSHQVSGATAAHGTILWTHDGHGMLNDETTLTPTYMASSADAGNDVVLTMTVTSDNACGTVTATANYTITVLPEEDPLLPGDANCDGDVDILDVVQVINYILGNNPEPFCFDNADVDQSGIIDVLDVVSLINMILGNTNKQSIPSYTADIYLKTNMISFSSDGTLTAIQFELTGSNLVQLELELKLDDHQLVYNIVGDRLYGIVFHPENIPLSAGTIDLIALSGANILKWGEVYGANISAPQTERVEVRKHGLLTEGYMLSVSPNPSRGMFTAHYSVPVASQVKLRIMDTYGREVQQLAHAMHEQGSYHIQRSGMPVLQPGFYILQMQATSEEDPGIIFRRDLKLVVIE